MAREALEWFAEKMEQKLAKNDKKGGWDGASDGYLLRRISNERAELARALRKLKRNRRAGRGITTEDCAAVVREAADVANFAFMIADNYCTESRLFGPSYMLERTKAELEALRETIAQSFGWGLKHPARNHASRVIAIAARLKELEASVSADRALAEQERSRAASLEAENKALRAKLVAWEPTMRVAVDLRHSVDAIAYGYVSTVQATVTDGQYVPLIPGGAEP